VIEFEGDILQPDAAKVRAIKLKIRDLQKVIEIKEVDISALKSTNANLKQEIKELRERNAVLNGRLREKIADLKTAKKQLTIEPAETKGIQIPQGNQEEPDGEAFSR
jgi:predicted  nucleic acid-binding Zn-ribbon protein